MIRETAAFVILFLCICANVGAQSTEFTYQGRLLDGSLPANASYDLEFRLFDAESGGSELGTLTRNGVAVANGIFTVKLDFGTQFDGSTRWLAIAVKPAGNPNPFTPLIPRQPFTSAPYSIRSLNSDTAATATNSLQLGGVAASEYVQTADPRMSDSRDPLPGSASYIQNTTSPQSSSDFNISGTGNASTFNAVTQYNIGGNRVLGVGGTNNIFAGRSSGAANTGANNAFFGFNSGAANTSAVQNSFFGSSAGASNVTGDSNAFFGYLAGQLNVVGRTNSFFGANAGRNANANDNAFFGAAAGLNNTTGAGNTFIGRTTGLSNTTENNNTFIGHLANGAAGITNSTAIGSNAVVTASNTMVLGTSAVTVQAPGDMNIGDSLNVGGALTAATLNITDLTATGNLRANVVRADSFFRFGPDRILTASTSLNNTFLGIGVAQFSNITGGGNSFFGANAGQNVLAGANNSIFGAGAGSSINGGNGNSFFGTSAGANTIHADRNSFFGQNAGLQNTSGNDNSFFGQGAGAANTTACCNSFFGKSAGTLNRAAGNSFFGYESGLVNGDGRENVFVGAQSGRLNSDGSFNTFTGYAAGDANTTGEFNAFFGWNAGGDNTSGKDNAFFGANAGGNNTGDENSFFGRKSGLFNTSGIYNAFAGASAGTSNTTGYSNSFFGRVAGLNTTTGFENVFVGQAAGATNTTGSNNTIVGENADVGSTGLQYATALGADAVVSSSNSIVLGRSDGSDAVLIPGTLELTTLGTAGATDVCRNTGRLLSSCVSSLRFKSDIADFTRGIDVVRRLRPITFRWNGSGSIDVGFGAEEVASVEPLLSTFNEKGEIEGVKYKQITTVLVNAVNEQQAEIEMLKEQIKFQQRQVELIKKLFCGQNPQAEICK